MRRAEAGATDGAEPEAAVAHASSSSGGSLPDPVRARFEQSLGADLTAVRVHTGESSAAAAQAVGAQAYAVGNDIHFAAGKYQPDDPFGLHLLAHEVAHTVQQSGGTPHRQHKLEVSTAGDASELDADRAANAMVAGAPAQVGGGGAQLARKEEGGGGAGPAVEVVKNLDPAAEATAAIGARACAIGNDVYFGTGEYRPETPEGERLAAHEVAHTVQQRGTMATPQYQLAVSSPGDGAELEADHAADAMVAGRPAEIRETPAIGTVQRTPSDGDAGAGPATDAGPAGRSTAGADAGPAATPTASATADAGAPAAPPTEWDMQEVLAQARQSPRFVQLYDWLVTRNKWEIIKSGINGDTATSYSSHRIMIRSNLTTEQAAIRMTYELQNAASEELYREIREKAQKAGRGAPASLPAAAREYAESVLEMETSAVLTAAKFAIESNLHYNTAIDTIVRKYKKTDRSGQVTYEPKAKLFEEVLNVIKAKAVPADAGTTMTALQYYEQQFLHLYVPRA